MYPKTFELLEAAMEGEMKGAIVVVVNPYMGPPLVKRRKYRSLLYESISAARPLGIAEEGEHLILLGKKTSSRSGLISVLHPDFGVCFIRRIDIKAVNESR